ncbi:MAG: glycosyltransferase family 2 protein [Acidimicrobiia bacterium]
MKRDPTDIRTLSVVMPVFNEAETLPLILERVLKASVNLDLEIVCVDDGSSDASSMVLDEWAERDPRIRVVRHATNRGKGAAVRTAIEHITGDVAIIQDADLEYDPADYAAVLGPILAGSADVVYGSRFAGGAERRVQLFWHGLGNRILTMLANALNDLDLTDMETCYKAFRTDILTRLRLTASDFRIEPEITSRLAGAKMRIYEVPVSYHGRTYSQGKKIRWTDGVLAVVALFKYRFVDREPYRS